MKVIETLDWILDNDDKSIVDDEKYRLNIEFVHSLGLKCDCVGWSTLDLQNPRTNEILSAIDSFCKKTDGKPEAFTQGNMPITRANGTNWFLPHSRIIPCVIPMNVRANKAKW